ncbi:hypothetical protein AAF712_004839 [Marasmius tenuissimus]|uniref:Uncharacterized protein n=1 Tax=Marasmius tenuissimus TaxID=585030 RepID=A0ABR3A474_9AGAR
MNDYDIPYTTRELDQQTGFVSAASANTVPEMTSPTNNLEPLLPHDDLFVRNTGDSQRPLNLQKEWAFRKEQMEPNPCRVQLGMPVPSQEHWNNPLLGRFVVIRAQVGSDSVGLKRSRAPCKFLSRFYPKSSGQGSPPESATGIAKEVLTKELAETKSRGDMYKSNTSHRSSEWKPHSQTPTMSVKTHQTSGRKAGEPPQQRLVIRKIHSPHPEPGDRLSFRPEQADGSRPPLLPHLLRHPLGYDPLHPAVIVHKHSKVSAFSMSRHHRSAWARGTGGNPSSPSRSKTVIMLAQRNVQEAFTNTKTTRRLAQAMSSMNTDRDEEVIEESENPTKPSAKSGPSMMTFEAKGLGDGAVSDPPTEKPSRRGALWAAFSEVVPCTSRTNPVVDDEANIDPILIAPKPRAVDSHKAYGTQRVLDLLQYSRTAFRSCRIFHSSILKRLSSKPRDGVSAGNRGSIFISSSNIPVGLTLPKREQQGTNRMASEATGEMDSAGLFPNVKDGDVLSGVPRESLFMLLPLWPGETDPYSQRYFPFEIPTIPTEERMFLLVYYRVLTEDMLMDVDPQTTFTPVHDRRNILLPHFHIVGRHITHMELQGSGIRLPDQGLAVSGPLEKAYNTAPKLHRRLPSTTSSSSDPSFSGPQAPSSVDAAVRECIMGTCYSRDSGIEFDPRALSELGLCNVLEEDTVPYTLPPFVFEEDIEWATTVKLTPIGSAVIEMVLAGGLALTSFESVDKTVAA